MCVGVRGDGEEERRGGELLGKKRWVRRGKGVREGVEEKEDEEEEEEEEGKEKEDEDKEEREEE